jgi:hypothetical protein
LLFCGVDRAFADDRRRHQSLLQSLILSSNAREWPIPVKR